MGSSILTSFESLAPLPSETHGPLPARLAGESVWRLGAQRRGFFRPLPARLAGESVWRLGAQRRGFFRPLPACLAGEAVEGAGSLRNYFTCQTSWQGSQ